MYIYHYQNPRREKRALYHDNPVLAFYADDSPVKETKPIQTTETRSSTENRNRKKKRKEKSVSGNNRPAVVDGLGGVLDLEDAAVGGEGGDGEIVARSYAAHCSASILFLVDLMFRSERVWTVCVFRPKYKEVLPVYFLNVKKGRLGTVGSLNLDLFTTRSSRMLFYPCQTR